jgi:exodeoxyribonuclease VII large subunit
MENTYLSVSLKDEEAAKALGIRWDSVKRQWYVPDGRALTTFSVLLSAGSASVSKSKK